MSVEERLKMRATKWVGSVGERRWLISGEGGEEDDGDRDAFRERGVERGGEDDGDRGAIREREVGRGGEDDEDRDAIG